MPFKMPMQSNANDNCLKTVGHILFPVGVLGAGWFMYLKRKDQQEWFEKLRKPKWYTTDPMISMIAEFSCFAPVGYAASLVLREARGDDRHLALALYGASWAGYCAVAVPIVMLSKDHKKWGGVSVFMGALFGATAVIFYQINHAAGLLLVPMTGWWVYNSIALLSSEDEKS